MLTAARTRWVDVSASAVFELDHAALVAAIRAAPAVDAVLDPGDELVGHRATRAQARVWVVARRKVGGSAPAADRLFHLLVRHRRTIAGIVGGVFRALPTYGTGEYGCQYSHDVSPERALPQNAPAVDPRALVGPEDTILQQLSPLGIRLPAPMQETHVSLAPVQHGLLYVGGVRSLTAPGQVEIVRLSVGNGSDIARNATPFDAAAFATEKCFCPVDWGCSNLISITLRGLVPNATLNWVLFGTLQQSWNSCYPSLGTVEEHAAAVWGLVNGKDAADPDTVRQWKDSTRGPSAPTRELFGRTRRQNPKRAATRRLAQRVRAALAA